MDSRHENKLSYVIVESSLSGFIEGLENTPIRKQKIIWKEREDK